MKIQALSKETQKDFLSFMNTHPYGPSVVYFGEHRYLTPSEMQTLEDPSNNRTKKDFISRREEAAERLIERGKLQGLICMSDGKAVGFCGCNRKSEFVCMGRSVPEGFYKASTEDTLVISDMVTAVEYRKRGIAGKLLGLSTMRKSRDTALLSAIQALSFPKKMWKYSAICLKRPGFRKSTLQKSAAFIARTFPDRSRNRSLARRFKQELCCIHDQGTKPNRFVPWNS